MSGLADILGGNDAPWMGNPERKCNPDNGANPELWFAYGDGAHAAATALCNECPVRVPCAQYALDDHTLEGIWGALTDSQRSQLRDKKPAA